MFVEEPDVSARKRDRGNLTPGDPEVKEINRLCHMHVRAVSRRRDTRDNPRGTRAHARHRPQCPPKRPGDQQPLKRLVNDRRPRLRRSVADARHTPDGALSHGLGPAGAATGTGTRASIAGRSALIDGLLPALSRRC
ncbi:hypothetical protein GCM10023323_16310 [Streptomyces thinghirensis]|uniref:HNH endonuclease n=1 Tax=Streptomyces thinghirensis TaxID=551547 RepID=A0ABP9T0T6_9ACTN